MPVHPLQPVFVLVNPQMGENIGATARAMLNFGLTDLRLVAPRDGWPNEKADAMSAGALAKFHLYKFLQRLPRRSPTVPIFFPARPMNAT